MLSSNIRAAMIPAFSVNFPRLGTPNNDDNRCNIHSTRVAMVCIGLIACSPAFQKAILPPAQAAQDIKSDTPTTQKRDFAEAMAHGMVTYEASVADEKKTLFSVVSSSDTVADVGLGVGPNLRFLPRGVRVIGIEPNQFMWPYAREKAKQHGIHLRLVNALSEDIPLASNSCDFVITTLTLCSVGNPSTSIREIYRILKPGGSLLFIEHVRAPMWRPILRAIQHVRNTEHMSRADGCNLNRNTIKLLNGPSNPGFTEVKFKEVHVKFDAIFNPMCPQLAGYARK